MSTLATLEVWASLWVGPIPAKGTVLHRAGFTMLVMTAKEAQTAQPDDYPGIHVVRAPLVLPDTEVELPDATVALAAGKLVADHLRTGGKVYIACPTGRSRSCFVAALALHHLLDRPGAWCATQIRKRFIDTLVLRIPQYLEFLMALDGKRDCPECPT